MSKEIKFEKAARGGRFFIPDETTGDQAELTFIDSEGVWVANHTYVPQSQRGQGIAATLVDELIQVARKQGVKIKPTCPYVKDKFDQHPEWSDLLG